LDKERLLDDSQHDQWVAKFENLVDVICDDHVAASRRHITNQALQAELISQIKAECKGLLDYREAAQRWRLNIDHKSKDRIVAIGERLSCRFVTTLLQNSVISASHNDQRADKYSGSRRSIS
jgi:aspartate kinase